ncbi:MAG: hypothetical protein GEEBNDBF_01568 [bacterium]|nr:hypothetical protein [bacterium]
MRWSTALWTGIGSMPPLRRLPLVLLCLVLGMLAGCRGQRGPHMIDIQGITPSGTLGAEGGSVEFAAQVDSSSGQPLTYAWTFSGGVTPATSGEESPTVSLTTAGSFTGGLTVTDGQALALASFSYDIETGVIVITGVTPSDPAGKPAGTVTFAADHTGTATEATWTFSGGTDVATSEELTPTVTLGEVGIYEGIVELRNENYTAVQPFSFRIDPPVAPSWRVMLVAPASTGSGPTLSWMWPGPAAFVWGERPGVVFTRDDGVYLALALHGDPQSVADWQISRIVEGQTILGTRIVATTPDSLHVLTFGDSPTTKGLCLSTTTLQEPAGEADWDTTSIDPEVAIQWACLTSLPGVGLLVGYSSMNATLSQYNKWRPVVAFCDGFAPTGPGSWQGHALESFPKTSTGVSQLLFHEASGTLMALIDAINSRYLTRATQVPPLADADWGSFVDAGGNDGIESMHSTTGSILLLDRRWRVVSSMQGATGGVYGTGTSLHSTTGPAPDYEGPVGYTLLLKAPRTGFRMSRTCEVLEGRGIGISRSDNGPVLWRQVTADPTLAGGWVQTPIHPEGGGDFALALLPDGRIFGAWHGPPDEAITIAISDGSY